MLARQVSAEGRSRAFAGGAAVPAAALSTLADPLVAVHGQSDQHRLLRPAAQRDALDRFAGDKALALRTRFAEGLRRAAGDVEAELADVVATARERAREADLLRFGLDEIEAVDAAARRGRRAGGRGEPARLRRRRCAPPPSRPARRCPPTTGPDALGAVAAARRLLDGRARPRPAGGRRSPTGSPRSATCSPTWPPTSRRTPRGWTPTPPGSPRSPSGGPRWSP